VTVIDELPAPLVAVGVDGTYEAAEAARYAAAVASDRGWDLVVVHADQLVARTDSEALVVEVVSALELGPRTQVRVHVASASPVATLREVSGSASLLVLGYHHFDRVDERLVGRTAFEVAAEARCPVLVVPPGWNRADEPGWPVVVALEVAGPAEPTLRCAVEAAELRGTEVVALHAVPVDGEGSVFTDEFFADERVSLGAILAGAQQDHPGVVVRSRLVYGSEGGRFSRGPTTAALVGVGPPRSDRSSSSWSRSVVRSVLGRSRCPLLITTASGGL
jgi:nucleotide-binding universal stress UspA family protein